MIFFLGQILAKIQACAVYPEDGEKEVIRHYDVTGLIREMNFETGQLG